MALLDLKTLSLGLPEYFILAAVLFLLWIYLSLLFMLLSRCPYRLGGLACFSPYDLVNIFNSLPFIRLRGPDRPDPGRCLPNRFFIYPFNCNYRFFHLKGNTLGSFNRNRVGIAYGQYQAAAGNFRAVSGSHQLQLFLPPLGNSQNHICQVGSRCAECGSPLLGLAFGRDRQDIVFYFDLDPYRNFSGKSPLGSCNNNLSRFNLCGYSFGQTNR